MFYKSKKHEKRPTFRRRLMVTATLLSVGVLAVTEGAVYLGARQALRVNMDRALLRVARAEFSPTGGEDAPAPDPGDEQFTQIEDAQDHVVSRTAILERDVSLQQMPTQEARARRGQTVFADTRLGAASLRCVYYPFHDAQGRPLLAIVGVSQAPMRRSLESLAVLLLLSLVAGAAGAAVGASRLAGHLTQPLQDIAAAARSVGGTDLSARLPAFSPDAELQDVTTVLNEMLAGLEAAFAAQRALTVSQSRFVADASHELRSPLSNLRGTVEVALRRPRTDGEYRETLTISLVEIERLSRIVADLLTLSRADAGEYRLQTIPLDLSRISAEAMAACAARAEAAGISLRLDADEPLLVLGDGDRLREIVDNLLDNALRHAPPGTTVVVTAHREGEAREGMACLTVTDAGPGLAEAEQARVFDRFYRADPSRTRQSGGQGLGLAIAKATAEAHGGQIGVRSQPGAGAAFNVRIPLIVEESV